MVATITEQAGDNSFEKDVDRSIGMGYHMDMTRNEVAVEIETLKMSIGVDQGFLNLVPPGSDKKTERQVEVDKKRLGQLRAMLEVAK